MRRYNVTASLAVSSTASTNTYPFQITTGAGAALQVIDLIIFQDGTTAPQDGTWIAGLAQASAASAGTATTPTPLDPNEGASLASASLTPTAVTLATTLPVALLTVGGNTRVTVRWAPIEPDAAIHQKAGLTTATSLIMFNQQPLALTGLSLRNSLTYKE